MCKSKRLSVIIGLLIFGIGLLYADDWQAKADMPSPRSDLAIGVVNGKVYAIGGFDGSSWLSTNEVYSDMLVVIVPNGGESWLQTHTYSIIWECLRCSERSGADHYEILLSTDGGNTYPYTIADSVSILDTTYLWTIPDSVKSNTCKVKVQLMGSPKRVLTDDESDGVFAISSVGVREMTDIMPANFNISLKPNPIRGHAVITCQVPLRSNVSIRIYSLTGRLVETLVNEEKEAGYYTIGWDANEIKGGIYFVRFRAD